MNLAWKNTTKEPHLETGNMFDETSKAKAPKTMHGTEHLQKLIEQIETTIATTLEYVSTVS